MIYTFPVGEAIRKEVDARFIKAARSGRFFCCAPGSVIDSIRPVKVKSQLNLQRNYK